MTKSPLPIWFISLVFLLGIFFCGGLANYVHGERQRLGADEWLLGFEILLWICAFALTLLWARKVKLRHGPNAGERRALEGKK